MLPSATAHHLERIGQEAIRRSDILRRRQRMRVELRRALAGGVDKLERRKESREVGAAGGLLGFGSRGGDVVFDCGEVS